MVQTLSKLVNEWNEWNEWNELCWMENTKNKPMERIHLLDI